MTLLEAEAAGLEVIADAIRYDAADHIWLLSIAGQATAVRGAWASLLGGSYLSIPSTKQLLTLAPPHEGWASKASRIGDPRRLGRAFGHTIILHPCTDPWSPRPEILVVDNKSSTPQSTLLRFLASRSSVPLATDWDQQIWNWAERNGSLTQLHGHGPEAWLATIDDKKLLDDFLPQFKAA